MDLTPKDKAKQGIKELIDKFKSNYQQFHADNYNEEQTRHDFINPFFELLGWDITNKAGLSQTYREVVVEDKIKIENKTKAPDYAFRFGGTRLFFVEAKKPRIGLKENIEAAYQIKRYSWSGKLGISILTNFEEFAIYDCSKKPTSSDRASVARIEYINYENYLDKFDFIYDTFAKENVIRGSLEKYNADTKGKKGTQSVDDEFLDLLDDLRTKLASNISRLNPNLSARDLNFAIQNIIDRIIFLRVAEDRGVEDYGSLRNACGNGEFYKNIVAIFKKADGKYNSGLFDFEKDKITQIIKVDNKIIKEIINDLYYPKSPYEFSVISIEIIGNAYEQFLGKTITIQSGHKAKIELKPEVRKAGGVYYTPEYIVDYIVANTLGEKIKGKKPNDISTIKILDPACGSGSFLLGAYKYLLNYHKEFFNKNPKARFGDTKQKVLNPNGELALWVKKQILSNNIFGVDIDNNAVEVTKLSLLLKCMENETPASIADNYGLFNERALPSLDENIKCGNSLISSDFYTKETLDLDLEAQYKINCFDWEVEFSEIFKNGGFDIVIGNPPYVNIQTLGHNSIVANYIAKKYIDIWQDKSDILFYFLYKGIKLSNSYAGFIVSNAFLFANKARKLRNFILDNATIQKVVNFEKFMVFDDASITTSIVIFNKNDNDSDTRALSLDKKIYEDIPSIINNDSLYLNVRFSKDSNFILQDRKFLNILNKIKDKSVMLENILYVGKGMETAANKVYSFAKIPHNFPKEYIKQRMSGEMIARYYTAPIKEYVLYVENVTDFKKLPKIIQKHLLDNKQILKQRATVSYEGRIWWKYSRPMHKELYKYSKIWTSYRGMENRFTLDETSDFIGFTNTTVIFQTNKNINLKYVLGIINSKLLNFYHHKTAKQTGGGVFEYVPNVVGKFPIKILKLNNRKDKEIHDRLVNLVDTIIEANKKILLENNPNTKTILKRQINAIDSQIDKLIYQLYDLNDDEIKLIES